MPNNNGNGTESATRVGSALRTLADHGAPAGSIVGIITVLIAASQWFSGINNEISDIHDSVKIAKKQAVASCQSLSSFSDTIVSALAYFVDGDKATHAFKVQFRQNANSCK